jgi:hypothetical protein
MTLLANQMMSEQAIKSKSITKELRRKGILTSIWGRDVMVSPRILN